MRELHSRTFEYDPLSIHLGVESGGTSSTTSRTAAHTLGGISKDDCGTVAGPIPLDNIYVPSQYLNISAPSHIGLDGALDVPCGLTTQFKITNFDKLTTYTITSKSATVTRIGDTISYKAAAYANTDTLTINGRAYQITAHLPLVGKPTITSPTTGVTNRPASVTLVATPFSVTFGSDTHAASTWHISTSPTFSNTFIWNGDDVVNKTSYTVTGLAENTTYYARVEYKGATSGYGTWSDTVSFTTRLTYAPYFQTATLACPDLTSISDTSIALSLDGSYALVGASGVASNTGAVYVFKRTNGLWSMVSKLTASDVSTSMFFGCAVVMSLDAAYLAIGAYGADSSKGAVYIFLKGSDDTWTQQSKLTGSDAVANAWCGYSLAIDSSCSILAMGARGIDTRKGALYVFKRTGVTWSQLQKLRPTNVANHDCFGASVSLSSAGNLIVCGAPQDGNGVTANAGYGYFVSYYLSGASFVQSAQYYAYSIGFGKGLRFAETHCLAMSSDGSMLAISTPGSSPGKIAILMRNTGALTNTFSNYNTLTDPDTTGANFGHSPTWSQDANYLLFSNFSYLTQTGRVYLYKWKNNTLTLQAKIDPDSPTTGQLFGYNCVLSPDGTSALISAPRNTTPYSPTYVYN